MADELITSLEMLAPDQLQPAAPTARRPTLHRVGPEDAGIVRLTYVRIGAPLGWEGRSRWSNADWAKELSRPGVHAWLARVRGEIAGLLELEAQPSDEVGIVVFGLVPAFIGQGIGGVFLTAATRLAWELQVPSGVRPRRVWVQTSSRDHPHAIQNYKRRGFRIFRVEHRSGELTAST